jgi:hypothetical protein
MALFSGAEARRACELPNVTTGAPALVAKRNTNSTKATTDPPANVGANLGVKMRSSREGLRTRLAISSVIAKERGTRATGIC